MFRVFLEISTFVRPSGQWMGMLFCRELVLGFWGLEPETNLKWINIYWSCAPPILDVRLDRRSVWERCELRLFKHVALWQCAMFCAENLSQGFEVWNLKPIWNESLYIELVYLLFWTSVSIVGLSERGLNLGYLTCSLMAMCYVLCRELVLGFWGLEPETNLKWINIYWSCAPPILDVRLDRRSVFERSDFRLFNM